MREQFDKDESFSFGGKLDARLLLRVLTDFKKGDFSSRLPEDSTGITGKIYDTINDIIDLNARLTREFDRISVVVGKEGKIRQRVSLPGATGAWADCVDSMNSLVGDLIQPITDVSRVIGAVAKGDLSQNMDFDVEGRHLIGEFLRTAKTVNTMVDQLSTFTSEVIRVAREVGTEGKLGGQAKVKGVSGAWKDLTDNVNFMAWNLTNQVRNIAAVTTAVADGNLSKKITVDALGEIGELKNTVNTMVDQLSSFASEVARVAREVGMEGKLGGQANVPNAAGTWRDLTDSVNRMAAALTSQVRAIADVATAVTKGDLSRSIAVSAAGEVAFLTDNINEMIRNLRETTKRNNEQDWLKTNLARFTRLLQGQRDLLAVSKLILSELAQLTKIQQGVFYINDSPDGEPDLRLVASYAFNKRKPHATRIQAGDGLVGQAASERQRILLTDVPPDYIRISSSLGEVAPVNVIVLPVLFEGQVKAVIEVASLNTFSDIHITFFDQLAEIIGIILNTITATMRTEELLEQSQSLAVELQARQSELTETNAQLKQQTKTLRESEDRLKAQQEELQQTNEELEEKARLLFRQNKEVERNNVEIEKARSSLEEKAGQLALTSKYKSEFLTNMSHELRTPLNSMLILARLLWENEEGNLTQKQVEYAQTIHTSGDDLLELINEILDLSRIESGAMEIEVKRVLTADVRDYVRKNFEALANIKGLEFAIDVRKNAPKTIFTDPQRLQQILKNLLSNAFKFTEKGGITLRIETVTGGWSSGHRVLDQAEQVVALSVIDTGIGISRGKHQIIFEAFQQADGTITRKFGGTGLGLSISREITRMLGGEIRVTSEPGQGSMFTLYLPRKSHLGSQEGKRAVAGATQRSADAAVPSPERGPGGSDATPVADAEEILFDDRGEIHDNDRVLLIVDPQIETAERMLQTARRHGFKGIISARPENANALAREFSPDAVALAPDTEGWIVLDQLKRDLATRHIPVQVIGNTRDRQHALNMGAFTFIDQGASEDRIGNSLETIKGFLGRDVKSLLVVEDDENQRKSILELIGDGDVESVAVGSGAEALRKLRASRFDCMVIDLRLPDMSGFALLERLTREPGFFDLPVIVYTAKELTAGEETQLRKLGETIVLKEARSPQRLLAETALYLHRASEKLPPSKRRMLEEERRTDPTLAGRKVLIIDDDVRNIFSLTSLLERHRMQVVFAENGRDGVELLRNAPDLDAILVDIMMPEMDGYETMREIRKIESFKNTPMIALTAKAMKGDREKCVAAGASDYVSKPADVDRLLSLLRVYLGA